MTTPITPVNPTFSTGESFEVAYNTLLKGKKNVLRVVTLKFGTFVPALDAYAVLKSSLPKQCTTPLLKTAKLCQAIGFAVFFLSLVVRARHDWRTLNTVNRWAKKYSIIPITFGYSFAVSSYYNFLKAQSRSGKHRVKFAAAALDTCILFIMIVAKGYLTDKIGKRHVGLIRLGGICCALTKNTIEEIDGYQKARITTYQSKFSKKLEQQTDEKFNAIKAQFFQKQPLKLDELNSFIKDYNELLPKS